MIDLPDSNLQKAFDCSYVEIAFKIAVHQVNRFIEKVFWHAAELAGGECGKEESSSITPIKNAGKKIDSDSIW